MKIDNIPEAYEKLCAINQLHSHISRLEYLSSCKDEDAGLDIIPFIINNKENSHISITINDKSTIQEIAMSIHDILIRRVDKLQNELEELIK